VTERLDAIIDEVAATMTAGEPRADFDARIARCVAAHHDPPSAIRHPRYRIAMTAFAVAAVMIAAFVMRPRQHRLENQPRTAATTTVPAPVPVQLPTRPAMDARAQPPLATTQHAVRSPRPATERTPVPGALPPLVNSRIDVAPLAVDALTSAPISLDRLDTIERIDVAPLTLDDSQRRDR
jgi:hypothetical protein